MKEKTARTWTPTLGLKPPDVLLPDIHDHPRNKEKGTSSYVRVGDALVMGAALQTWSPPGGAQPCQPATPGAWRTRSANYFPVSPQRDMAPMSRVAKQIEEEQVQG